MVRVSQDCLHTVTTLSWPARSLDLSPIEHIWDLLGWRNGHPTSLNELEAKLQEEEAFAVVGHVAVNLAVDAERGVQFLDLAVPGLVLRIQAFGR
ncbi:hypothetical protein TNCV_4832851 [Trichonephila clavipes]|nr:hypothetical protein TNCV_4832851 [Trichonephila clavipes]